MNELFSLLSSFVNLPPWLKYTIYLLVALSLVGIGVGFSPTVALIAGIGILFVVVVLGIYLYLLKHRREARTAALGGELQQNTQATPSAISDPARKARLEDLRKRFQQGLDKFKAVGKDLYRLPWYVVIGEPAAGKSEAIRHCDVGFPPGMQDDFQGVGGTINMNWWFTNYAVVLDTAGRLLFEEVAPGTTSEWKEFLGLLRKHRPNCPINGLLLVIPADSLVRDSEKRIDERAGVITRQLENIQRELDIRFPVYVIIAKCDLLNGFREFFEDIDDPGAQRQMLGWSNPDSIDKPFALELVDQHLRTVVERLRRRRLKLLEDPVAKDSSHRRTDEVDRLYAFPNSISLITPNLRRYLSTIFVKSEWSTRPLFLRGIYFTSSLREGSELDQELAQAIGVSVDDLPSGRVWERETSYFLRDLFIDKIFREWGLVTRATNTLRMLRRRKLAIFGFGAIALAVFLFLSLIGYRAMKESIGHQSGYWLRASEGWSAQNEWLPIVRPTAGGYTYNGDEPVGRGTGSKTRDLFDGAGKSLVQFHTALRDFTGAQLRISAIFRPFYRFAGSLTAEKSRAQRIVFEGSVVKPLVEAARNKISAPETAPSPDPNPEANALLSLIRIESGIVKRQQNLADKIALPAAVLAPLQTYVAGREFDPRLTELSNWTYSKGGGADKWPAAWLSAGDTLARGKPGYNQPMDLGIERFRKNALQSLAASEARWKLVIDLVNFLKNEFAPKEKSLFQAASQPGVQQRDSLMEKAYKELSATNQALNQKLQNAKAAGLFKEGPVSLGAAYELILKERTNQQSTLKSMLDELLTETVSAETNTAHPTPLLKEIQDRLNAILKEIQVELQGLNVAELKALDEAYLGDYTGHGPVGGYRFGLYSLSFGTTQLKAQLDSLIGSDLSGLKKIIEDVARARTEVAAYNGQFKEELQLVCDDWLNYAERHQIDEFSRAYVKQGRDAIAPFLRFPLVWPPAEPALTTDQVRAAARLVAAIHRDLQSESFKKMPSESSAPLAAFDKQISRLDPALRGLLSPNGTIAVCSIALPGASQGQTARISDVKYELRAGTPFSGNHANLGKQGKVPLGQQRVLIDKLPVDTVFHFHRYDPAMHEVPCGLNWCALRLLTTTTQTSEFEQDGINWKVRIDDAHPDVIANLVFEYELPKLRYWPTRQDVLPSN
ncbi:MAG TPA: type VI secretion protein IcmF/TssM N-terminal domain-containing protein [Terrimicrobiaceae bacterium]